MFRRKPREPFRLEVGLKGVESDVDSEFEFHLAMRTRKLIAEGLDPKTAREQALQRFGNLPAARAECLTIDRGRERALRRANWLGKLRQASRNGARRLCP